MSKPAVIDPSHEDHVSRDAGARGGMPPQSPIEIGIYHQLDVIEPEWRRFEQGADCSAFQAFDWLAAWCRYVGPLEGAQPVIVVGCKADGTTLFILPLAVTSGVVRRLTWLGSDLCDYNGPLLAKEFSSQVPPEDFRALWQDIGRRLMSDPLTRYDLVSFSKLPERVGAQANPFLALATDLNPSNAYVTDLFGTWEEFYGEKRSSATRRRDRTKLKKLGEYGDVHFVTPQDRDEITRTIGTLMEQKSRSFARMGVANIFARPGWSAFFAAIASDPNARNLVHVSRLDIGATWSAINLGLVFRDTYYHVLASHDDGEASRLGPGVAHLRELLRYSIEHGLKHFDFTIGDERYKSEWSDRTLRLYDHVAAVTVRGWVVATTMRAHRRVKRLIKQNEMLWSLFSRVRAAFGSKSAKPADGQGTIQATTSVHPSPSIAPE
jgi:CelD/BcsL family acetyltransferase involved in cellulose biosynthesis